MTQQHVFILGAGRSGTKILRDCLGAAEDVSAIPYDVGYVWKFGNQRINHDELLPSHARPDVVRYIRNTMKSMAIRSASGRQFNILIEKSVPNTLRPAFMRVVFPDAKFIHLVRDGRDVVESSMRNWESPSDTGYFWQKLRYFPIRNAPYALWYVLNRARKLGASNDTQTWGPRYEGIQADANTRELLEVCARQWSRCVETCHRQLAEFPEKQVMDVRYEEFVSERGTLEAICRFAGIEDRKSVLSFYDTKVVPHGRSFSGERLSQNDRKKVTEIANEMLIAYGYET